MRLVKKILKIVLLLAILAFAFWWFKNSPPDEIKISGPITLSPISDAINAVTPAGDYIAEAVYKTADDLPAYDEVILSADEKTAFIPTMDGSFWKIDVEAGTASHFVDVPLMAAGARRAPDNAEVIYFCASYLFGVEYPQNERVGLYRLDTASKTITPLVIDVPQSDATGGEAKIFANNTGPSLRTADMNAGNSRALTFCNDLDVSADGKRIYFTEPFSYGRPTMGGGGTYREAITLGQNGRVWQYNLDTTETRLIAQNFIFPDGILIEDSGAGIEETLLVTETIQFRILRLSIGGDNAGEWSIVQENLPGMPDGMDRDTDGRIWVGIIKQRSPVIDWIHGNPWIKPFFLRLPANLMPVSAETSLMAFSKDGSTPLFYSLHDGSVLSDISVIVPGRNELFVAAFNREATGLFRMPYPLGLELEGAN